LATLDLIMMAHGHLVSTAPQRLVVPLWLCRKFYWFRLATLHSVLTSPPFPCRSSYHQVPALVEAESDPDDCLWFSKQALLKPRASVVAVTLAAPPALPVPVSSFERALSVESFTSDEADDYIVPNFDDFRSLPRDLIDDVKIEPVGDNGSYFDAIFDDGEEDEEVGSFSVAIPQPLAGGGASTTPVPSSPVVVPAAPIVEKDTEEAVVAVVAPPKRRLHRAKKPSAKAKPTAVKPRKAAAGKQQKRAKKNGNRIAAKKFRDKQKTHELNLVTMCAKLEASNTAIERELAALAMILAERRR
jgi:hypothetical protein